MDKSEDMVSSENKSPQNLPLKEKPTRTPMCTKCRYHGFKNEVKYHKRECKFRFCLCASCILVTKRQKVMKEQTAQRRQQQQYEILREMRKKKVKEKDMDISSAASVNGSNSSNSNDTPTNLSNHTSNGEPSRIVGEPPVTLPTLLNMSPLLPPSMSSEIVLYEPELSSNTHEVETLIGFSTRLLQQIGYPVTSMSVSLMYVILKGAGDVSVAMRRIAEGFKEIETQGKMKIQAFNNPVPGAYYPVYHPSAMTTLGNPTYIDPVPYVGMPSPPTTAGLGFFPYPLRTHAVVSPKVPSSPDSPPERPSSYPDFMKTRMRTARLNGSMESILEKPGKEYMEVSPNLPGFKLDSEFVKTRMRTARLNGNLENTLETGKEYMEVSPNLPGFKLDSDASESRYFKVEKNEDAD